MSSSQDILSSGECSLMDKPIMVCFISFTIAYIEFPSLYLACPCIFTYSLLYPLESLVCYSELF